MTNIVPLSIVLIKSLNLYLGLYRRIVSCVLLRSGLGSPTDIAVVREATGLYVCGAGFSDGGDNGGGNNYNHDNNQQGWSC